MNYFFAASSTFPSHRRDKIFFDARPDRQFRARAYEFGDAPFPEGVTLFSDGKTGAPSEVSLTIIKRFPGGRARYVFAGQTHFALKDDRKIINFLKSRGINADTMGETFCR